VHDLGDDCSGLDGHFAGGIIDQFVGHNTIMPQAASGHTSGVGRVATYSQPRHESPPARPTTGSGLDVDWPGYGCASRQQHTKDEHR
jgi:hypothetical protein